MIRKREVIRVLDFRMDTFLTVCRLMNYTKAADALHITQPAVSQHIRFLENAYQTQLFSYSGKKLLLTQAGETLRRAAQTMRHDETFLKQILGQGEKSGQSLRFGVTPTVGMYLLPPRVAAYRTRFPEADLQMMVDNTQALLNHLDDGTLDFAIVEGYFGKMEYDFLPFRRERYVALCAAGHTFAKTPRKLEDLLEETLLIREQGSGNREIIARSLSRQNLLLSDFHNRIEVSDMNVLKVLLTLDCGVAFLYEAAAAPELRAGTLREIVLTDFQEEHDITFIWPKNSAFSARYRQLFDFFQNRRE